MALVLIVDDDASITTSLALLLKQAGHASRSAETLGPSRPALYRRLEKHWITP